MPPNVTVLSTGGTIASTSGENGATPSRTGTDLVEAVPQLQDYADIDVREVVQTPSFDINPDDIAQIAREARSAADEGKTGVVVTHGTDTMEESAFYLDLVLDLSIPVVLTGAQRRSDEVSADGPNNLLTAVRAATSDHLAGKGGVYIAFDEELHAARDVTKEHTSDLSTFASPDKCPIIRFTRYGTRVLREPGSRSTTLDVTETEKTVAMVKVGIGISDQQLRQAVDAGVDGIVVEGTGLGNTTSALGHAIADAIDAGVPVVITSRCNAGVVDPVYGTPGGGETLHSHGVINGDDLPAHKARVKLMLVLEMDDDNEAIREIFA